MSNQDSAFKSLIPCNSTIGLLKIYRYFLFHTKGKQIVASICIALVAGIIPSVDGILLQNITDSIEIYSDQEIAKMDLVSLILKWVIIYAVWWECLNIMWRLYDYLYLKSIPVIRANVTDEFFNYVQYHSHEFFQANLAGDITNRITEATRSIEMIFAYFNEKVIRTISTLICALVVLYTVHPIVALIFFVWFCVFVGTSLYFSKTINRYSKTFSQNKAKVAGKIVDSIANISVIRMFSSNRFERNYIQHYSNDVVASDQKLQWFMFKLRYALGISCTIMISCMIYYIITLRSNLEISIGQCVLIISLCLAIIDDVWDLTQEFGDLFEQLGAFNQSISLLGDYAIKDIANASNFTVKLPKIEFNKVTFCFLNNDNIFENQSITIQPYERVGLAGFSGSGKSTFASLIYRLYDIESGVISIDGQDITKVSQNSLRSNISVIPQEPILFHRSIRENISYAKPQATDEEIFAAAKAAHIHELILSLPQQYDTICGERGNNLSGGQKQRISIARAFLKDAPILILDEATSALDNHTEELIQQSLKILMKNKTVIVIAHRLSTLTHMDRILVFDKGHIVENGPHDTLKKKGSMYKLLLGNY